MFNLNPFSSSFFQLYILQLDEYDILRFLKILSKVKRGKKLIKTLVWTNKAKLIYLLSLLQILLASWLIANLNLLVFGSILFISLQLFFLPLILSVILLFPFDYISKKIIISKAKTKIKSLNNLKIIAIAGSYGKTTFKEILHTILSEKYRVLKTPESINTPIGISRLILSTLSNNHDIFIVEMGEYYKNDIKNLCKITPPDISVVTGINEAHFERLKSIEATVSTIFEVVENSKDDALIVINSDDKLVNENYKKHVNDKNIIFYGLNNNKSTLKASEIRFNEDKLTLDFNLIEGKTNIDSYTINIIAEYAIADIIGAVQIARKLDISWQVIKLGIGKIKPVPYRLAPKYDKEKDILVIDDTFNTNPEGVDEAINLLSKFKKRRKIYITPGMAETGIMNRKIHLDIAVKLSKVANLVILIKTSSSLFMYEGLKNNKYSEDKIIFFDSIHDVYNNLNKITKPNDVVLFQNIWPENYV